jgi:hypothetical protein
MQLLTFPLQFSLKGAVTRLENAIVTLSGTALAISGIIAGIDLLTGGSMFKNVGWLSLTWAICLLLTLDFQVLVLGSHAKRIYNGDKHACKKFFEILAIVAIAAAISYVSIQMQSIIARSQAVVTSTDSGGHQATHATSIDQATRDMGINPIALIWERSSLVLVLIFMSGCLREEQAGEQKEPPQAQASDPAQAGNQYSIVIDYTKLAEAVLAAQPAQSQPVLLTSQAQSAHGTADSDTGGTGDTPEADTGQDSGTADTPAGDNGTADNATRIAAFREGHPEASKKDIAEALGISTKTVSRHWTAERTRDTLPDTDPQLVAASP